MAGKNAGKLFQRVCQQSAKGTLLSLNQGAQRVIQHAKSKKPAWLLAAAPFVWAPPNVPGPQDEEDYEEEDYEDDDEEDEEEDIRSAMMLPKPPTNRQWQNWNANAESNPQYQKTVHDAQKILQTPPPPPPKFPELPAGFCVDPQKVPPVPPSLPTLKFLAFHDDENNNSKQLPSTCPSASPVISEAVPCPPQHMHITPKMPDLPFCDRPIPPPALPMPPPCDELGPPPPPPPDPPMMMTKVEKPPPPLPAPPPMSYDLPPPPRVFTPHTNDKIPPLPCLPHSMPEAGMEKCNENANHEQQYGALAQIPKLPKPGTRGESSHNSSGRESSLPPPPPMLRSQPISSIPTSSYWQEISQHEQGMMATPRPRGKRTKRGKKKKILSDQEPSQEGQEGLAAPATAQVEEAPKFEAVDPEPQEPNQKQEEEQFQVRWSSKPRRNTRRF